MRAAIRALYRVRSLLFFATAIALIVATVIAFLDVGSVPQSVQMGLAFAILAAGSLAIVLTLVGPRTLDVHDPVVVVSPVRGRWVGLNSPASKVPSHGVRMYGQAYAIDLAAEPHSHARPVFGEGPWMRKPSDYPAFGEPVYAMLDGIVVQVHDRKRDHRARSGWVSLVYLMGESMTREIGGPGFLIGNRVTIRRADGVYALVAHLQQGSASVKVGDSVHAGQLIGRCGNSGNTSEPHVHAQLMDRASLLMAQGIPMAFANVDLVPKSLPGQDEGSELVERELVTGLPRNNQHMLVRE